jgi:glucosamine-6-phosphate deaminase
MNIIVTRDYEEMSQKAAEIIASKIKDNASCVLGLATGSSPIGTYKNLIKMVENKEISFKNVNTYNLDEYCGISKQHPQSYYYFMHDNLFNHVDIDERHVHLPSATGKTREDFEKNCQEYNNQLNQVSVDLQLLGIGGDGHIGFCEPGTKTTQETFVVELTDRTRQDNKRFFNSLEEVPTHAMTMGIANIMRAKSILMLISGANKAETVEKLMSHNITTDFPASVLWLHPNCTVIIDEAAYSKMNK